MSSFSVVVMHMAILHISEKIACVWVAEKHSWHWWSRITDSETILLYAIISTGTIVLLCLWLQSWYQGEGFFPLKFDIPQLFQLYSEKEIISWELLQIHEVEILSEYSTHLLIFHKCNNSHYFFMPSFEAGGKISSEHKILD